VEPGTKTNLTDFFQVINAKRILPFPTLESHLSLDANRQRLRMVKATLIRRETRLRANVSVGYTHKLSTEFQFRTERTSGTA
jgi:hypothetical protein